MYKLTPRTAKLTFEGGEYAGAEVKIALDRPLGMFIEAQALQREQNIEGLCHFIARLLIEWNLEDDEGALPTDYEGLMRVYPAFLNLLIAEWVKAQTTLPLPSAAP